MSQSDRIARRVEAITFWIVVAAVLAIGFIVCYLAVLGVEAITR